MRSNAGAITTQSSCASTCRPAGRTQLLHRHARSAGDGRFGREPLDVAVAEKVVPRPVVRRGSRSHVPARSGAPCHAGRSASRSWRRIRPRRGCHCSGSRPSTASRSRCASARRTYPPVRAGPIRRHPQHRSPVGIESGRGHRIATVARDRLPVRVLGGRAVVHRTLKQWAWIRRVQARQFRLDSRVDRPEQRGERIIPRPPDAVAVVRMFCAKWKPAGRRP